MNGTRTLITQRFWGLTARTSIALAVVAAAALGSTGCKSNRARAQAAPMAPQPAPYAYTPAPAPSYPAPSYGPPPEVTYQAPPPPVDTSSDMTARALEAERKAREVAEERARQAEEMLKLATSPPSGGAGAGGGWPTAGGREGDAVAFSEELRTKCDAEVVQSGSSVVVRLSDAFRPGSDELKADVRQVTSIHAVAEALMRYPAAQVGVIGHTDSQPIKRTKDKWTDNVHLSRSRAETVARVLQGKGMDGTRLMVDGRGETEPLVYPERTASDRSRNRRVEIHVRF
jgi:flagellar motor protein MotB